MGLETRTSGVGEGETTLSKVVFWFSLSGSLYAYLGYPLLLHLLRVFTANKAEGRGEVAPEYIPSVSLLIPAHNEGAAIESKIRNTLSLDYPKEKLEIIVISDGSTDSTDSIVSGYRGEGVSFIELKSRGGKARALNSGLATATGEIIVFTDASILLEPKALRKIVCRFSDESIGCISGEDHILEAGGEGLYGRYELHLRNLESAVHSIVGASGSFYAQRRTLCQPFLEGMAPDFLSVLATVEMGYRAITEPSAIGHMASSKKVEDEFRRKERTILRGITTLSHKRNLLNPFRYGILSIFLFSHKVMRWLVPFFMILLIISNARLLEEPFYRWVMLGQGIFYLLACGSLLKGTSSRSLILKIPHYFCISNAAILTAILKYITGVRQEIWTPTQR